MLHLKRDQSIRTVQRIAGGHRWIHDGRKKWMTRTHWVRHYRAEFEPPCSWAPLVWLDQVSDSQIFWLDPNSERYFLLKPPATFFINILVTNSHLAAGSLRTTLRLPTLFKPGCLDGSVLCQARWIQLFYVNLTLANPPLAIHSRYRTCTQG